MQSQAVSNKQSGFTLVEVVAVMVITTILAAYAIPRMMGSSDVAAKVTADRVLAALQYAQVLAQRQGVPTRVEIAAGPILTVKQGVAAVIFSTQNYDGTDTGGKYDVKLDPDVSIAISGISGSPLPISYGVDGIPTPAGSSYSITINGSGMSFTIKVESTGFAHFV
jgi:prepilin-type N-terminal cleavage/methylation domain-containing protein